MMKSTALCVGIAQVTRIGISVGVQVILVQRRTLVQIEINRIATRTDADQQKWHGTQQDPLGDCRRCSTR